MPEAALEAGGLLGFDVFFSLNNMLLVYVVFTWFLCLFKCFVLFFLILKTNETRFLGVGGLAGLRGYKELEDY